jgi:hypothetical protein
MGAIMVLQKILSIFEHKLQGVQHQSDIGREESTTAKKDGKVLKWDPSMEDRRCVPDRRENERRVMHLQPYLNTRKNNGRRRSFGRRKTDQSLKSHFQ